MYFKTEILTWSVDTSSPAHKCIQYWYLNSDSIHIYTKYFLHVYKHIIKVLREFLIHSHELSIKSTLYWDNPRIMGKEEIYNLFSVSSGIFGFFFLGGGGGGGIFGFFTYMLIE